MYKCFTERLKRHDEVIISSLAEKHKAWCEIFGVEAESIDRISSLFAEGRSGRDAKEFSLAAVVQGGFVNFSLIVSIFSYPCLFAQCKHEQRKCI